MATTKDPFSTPLSDLKLRDWAKELPQPVMPRVPAAGAGASSAVGSAASIIRAERQRQQLEKQRTLQQAQAARATPPKLPSFEQARNEVAPNYDQLPFSEQNRIYSEYVKNSVQALKNWDESTRGKEKPVDEFELEEAIRSQNPGPVEPTRTWGQVAGDIGRGLAAGAVSIPAAAVAALNPASPVVERLSETAEELRAGMSPVEQDRQRQIAFETQQIEQDPDSTMVGRFLREAGVQVSNLSAAGLAELVGNIGPTLVATGGIGLAARGAAGALGASRAAATALGGRAATGAGIAAAPLLSGGDAAQGAYQSIMQLPETAFDADPQFQQALQQTGGDREAAKRQVAMSAARIAQGVGASAGLLFSALPGSLERSVGRAVGGQAVAGGLGRAVAGRAAEAALEGGEEALTQVGQNIGTAQVVPGQDLLQGAGGSFALGALGGGAGGAAVSGISRLGGGQPAPQTPAGAPNVAEELLGTGQPEQTPPGAATQAAEGGAFQPVEQTGETIVPPSPSTTAVQALAERLPNLTGDERIRAIELATLLRNPNTADNVRAAALAEAQEFIDNMTPAEAPAAAAVEPGVQPEGAQEIGRLTPEEARELASAYRRPVERPLEELQQAVRQETDFTTEARVAEVRNNVENAYLEALIAGEDPVAATEQAATEQIAAAEPSNYEAAVAEADARVRQSRIDAALQNLIDNNEGFTSTAINSLNRSLGRIGEAPLTEQERARVKTVTEAYQAFTNYLNPEGMPEPVGIVIPPGTDNTSMEALIRERRGESNLGQGPGQRATAQPGGTEPTAAGPANGPAAGAAPQAGPTAAAVAFNTEFANAMRRSGFRPDIATSMESTLAPLAQQIAEGGLTTGGQHVNAVRQMRELIDAAQRVNPRIATAIRNALRATENVQIGPSDGSAVGYAARQLGLGVTVRGSRDPWAEAVRRGGDGENILRTMAADPTVGLANQAAAEGVLSAYQASGVPVPEVGYRGVSPAGGARGAYFPAQHQVGLFPNSQARTVAHEMLHGLTVRGYQSIVAQANAGNVDAQNLVSLTNELHAKLKRAAGDVGYRGNADPLEMMAELVTPEFLELAAQTEVGTLTPGAQAALAELGVAPRDSILDAITKLFKRIVDLMAPGNQLSDGNIADVLAQIAAESTRWTAANTRRRGGAGSLQLNDAAVFDAAPAPGTTQAEQVRNNATEIGAENIEGTEADVKLQSPRESYSELLAGIESGQPAPPSSGMRGFAQAMRRRDAKGMRESIVQFGEFLNVKLHDHLGNVKRWMEQLPEGAGGVTPVLKEKLIGDMYRAPVVRDATLQRGMEQYGGRAVQKELGRVSAKYNMSAETATQLAGYWLTAQRAEAANQRLLDRDANAVKKAQDAYNADPSPVNSQTLAAATEQLRLRVEAVTNPDIRVKQHVAGVGGFSNAQANALIQRIEARIPRAELEKIAEKVYDFNAWRLATDVESGKADPAVVASFLNQPDVEPMLAALRVLADQADARNPASIQALDAKRKEVIERVRSNYVPLTGDPDTALSSEVFATGSRAPNVSPDYAMEGRTTSIPDDGITASFAGALKSASYAGWRDFQDSIAQVYNSLSPENREAVGIERQPIDGSGVMIGQNAIIRRRGNSAYAYRFRDQSFLDAIRGANVDDTSHVLQTLGKPTKWFAYAATQLNPFFAPRNYIRDAWERSELIRTRQYLNADGQPVDSRRLGRDMLAYTFNPAKSAPLVTATGRAAFGMKSSGSREALMLQEMLAAGGGSVFGDRFTGDRKKFVDGIMRERRVTNKALRPVAQVVDAYNRSLDMAPALAAYMALRDQGVPPDRAAAGTLDLMNFRKRGASMPVANAIWAFAQPAVTGGANAMSALFNPKTKRFSRVGLTRLLGYTVTLAAIQAFARSLADDDEGGNRLDQLGNFVHDNNLAIPLGDGVVRIPLAFGTTRLANGMARAMLGAGTGELTPAKAFGNYFSGSVVPVFSPIDDTDIDWSERPVQAFMMTFAPTWMKPVVSVGVNRTAFDSPVVFDNYEKTDQFRSEQFGKTVPPLYQDVARFLRANTGIDLAPEEVRTLIRGFPLGPGTMLLDGAVENPYRESRGKQVENPFLRQIYSGYSQQAVKGQFYDALEDTSTLLRRRNVGDDSLSDEDRRKLAWRASWDELDKELRKERQQVTRSGLSEQAKEQRYSRIQSKRDHAQTLAVYQYRQIEGKTAKRVDVPAQWVRP